MEHCQGFSYGTGWRVVVVVTTDSSTSYLLFVGPMRESNTLALVGTNDGGDLPCGLAEVDHEAGDQNAMSPSAILIAARPSSTRSTHTPDSPSIEPENTTARESGDHQVAERSFWSAKGT